MHKSFIHVALAAIIIGGALVGGCSSSIDNAAELDLEAGEQPEWVINDSQMIESDAGVRRWIIDYAQMTKFAGRREHDLVRVKMDFFDKGEYYSTLVSDSGIVDPDTRDVFVWGNVVITTDDGRRLMTSELTYNNEDGRIRNNVYNFYDRGLDDTSEGIGLEATPDLEYVEFYEAIIVVGDETMTDGPDTAEPR